LLDIAQYAFAEMMPYMSGFEPKTYGKDDKRDVQILMVCNNTTMHPDNPRFIATITYNLTQTIILQIPYQQSLYQR